MLVIMILIPILILILVIVLLVKVSDLQRTVEILSGASNKQQHIYEVTPEILEELKYLNSAGLTVSAESKLKELGFNSAEARVFIAAVAAGSGSPDGGLTFQLLRELKYLKDAGLDVTAESKLKNIGLSTAEARAFLAVL